MRVREKQVTIKVQLIRIRRPFQNVIVALELRQAVAGQEIENASFLPKPEFCIALLGEKKQQNG